MQKERSFHGSKNKPRNQELHGSDVFRSVIKAVLFFCLRLCGGGRVIFPAETVCRNGNRIVGVHFRSRALCGSWLYQIQRNDGGEIFMGMDKIRNSYAKKTHVSFYQHLFGADEAEYGKASKRDGAQKQIVNLSAAARR